MHPIQLPTPPTSFIGREQELKAVTTLFVEDGAQLVTLAGPGGGGKTRLALQVAAELQTNFTDGVYFVDMAPISDPDLMATTIASALGIREAGGSSLEETLKQFLHRREMLLILDNLEQLLLFGELPLIPDIIKNAPTVRVLATSREVLNLHGEWRYPLGGMPFPRERSDEEDSERFAAIRFFVACARRVNPKFTLGDEREAVSRICRLVDGLPLAIELAASWTNTLDCAEIADEIQRNVDFLATRLRDMPDRHRSMQAVFDHTWQLLDEEERAGLKRLSVFRGGFERQAALGVAGATLTVLSALIDKSLLRLSSDGRYRMHELLRQYAKEHLMASADEFAETLNRHANYYAEYLDRRAADLTGQRHIESIQEIKAEWDNIRLAWELAVSRKNVTQIRKAAHTFYYFCDSQGRYQEAADVMAKALETLQDEPATDQEKSRTIAQLLSFLGYTYIRLGMYGEARRAFTSSHAIFQELDEPPPSGFGTDPVTGLGLLEVVLGDYRAAFELAEEGQRQNEARADKLNLQLSYYVLESAALAQGDYEAADKYAWRAHALTRETNNRWMLAYVVSDLGDIARGLGNYHQAQQHYQDSYEMKRAFNDPEGMAAALRRLARVAWLQQEYPRAQQLFRESHAIYQEINDRGGLGKSLQGLGDTARASGEHQEAAAFYSQALTVATEIDWVPLMLSVFSSAGELLRQIGQQEQALALQAMVLKHPASEQETRGRAQKGWDLAHVGLADDIRDAAKRRGETMNLAEMTADLLILLEKAIGLPGGQVVVTGVKTPSYEQPRDDPLTPRELEVLQLIAQGLSNREIADQLVIAVGTVKSYTSQIYSKLYVTSRTQAVARARELRILSS